MTEINFFVDLGRRFWLGQGRVDLYIKSLSSYFMKWPLPQFKWSNLSPCHYKSFQCSEPQPYGYLSRLKQMIGIWWQLFDTGLLLWSQREVCLSLDNGRRWWFSQLWTHAVLAEGFGLCETRRMCVPLPLWMAWNVWTAFFCNNVNNAIVQPSDVIHVSPGLLNVCKYLIFCMF